MSCEKPYVTIWHKGGKKLRIGVAYSNHIDEIYLLDNGWHLIKGRNGFFVDNNNEFLFMCESIKFI